MDELEQRSTFLPTQVTDLTDSKQQLEELIDTINAESSLRFEQTFNAVREHFQGMFRKLFGGGKADIFLETEVEDNAEAEHRASAQTASRAADHEEEGRPARSRHRDHRPPAGQEAGHHQPALRRREGDDLHRAADEHLQEQAAARSASSTKWTPPLDEANNQRFGLIVQEFLEMSQFIIITHHKRTMQIADVLYGVTMQEQGVSKRVAVKFDQVDSQGRISEHAAA